MRGFVVALAALLATACTEQAPPDPAKAESYAVQIAVTPAAGGPLQRVPLPAAASVAQPSLKASWTCGCSMVAAEPYPLR